MLLGRLRYPLQKQSDAHVFPTFLVWIPTSILNIPLLPYHFNVYAFKANFDFEASVANGVYVVVDSTHFRARDAEIK